MMARSANRAGWRLRSRILLAAAVALAAIGCARRAGPDRPEDPAAVRPHFDARTRSTEYAGPGREDPEPEGLEEIRIGWFGPDDPEHPAGGDLWLAAGMAIEVANAAGGHRGLPFRLTPAWSENPWGTGVARVTRLAYDDGVWALIGSIDGASTHLAEQVVAKARLTLINPVATDNTVNLANVAWMFSSMPADDAHAGVLVRALLDRIGVAPFILVSTTDHDSRAAVKEFHQAMAPTGRGPRLHLEVPTGNLEFVEIIGLVAAADPAAIVVFAGPEDSARMAVSLRDRGIDVPILGGASMGRRVFLENAGAAAEGVVFPLGCDPAALDGNFARTFLERTGRRADCATIQTWDAVRLLVRAIRDAGLNRVRIRDAVEALSPWAGAAGPIRWNLLRQNDRPAVLVTVRDGRIVPTPAALHPPAPTTTAPGDPGAPAPAPLDSR